jgi:hypothetical protein
MTQKLHGLFSEVLNLTKHLLDETASFEHSLLTLILTSMQEQKETLDMLIPELDDEEKIKDPNVRNHITIVYHNHEVSSPVFRAWGRANEWMDLPSKRKFEKLMFVFPEMKKYLVEAASELEHIYGRDDIKYVVSSFYTPTK